MVSVNVGDGGGSVVVSVQYTLYMEGDRLMVVSALVV